MRSRWHAWHIALLAVLISGALAGYLFWVRSRTVPTVAERIQRLPAAVPTVFVDLDALRRSGILDLMAGQRVSEDPEYRRFVDAIGFDYRNDLDSVLVAYRQQDVFILATGRFDWKLIKDFTTHNGGSCRNGICMMGASRQGRYISYVPLSNALVGLAVSTDPWAVETLRGEKAPSTVPVPDAPLWATATGVSLKGDSNLPAGSKLFAQALSVAKTITFGLHPLNGGLEARLAAECVQESDAQGLLNQLQGVTIIFRKYLDNVNQKPNPEDLSGVLTSGTFNRQGNVVTGTWPIAKAFLDKLLSGSL